MQAAQWPLSRASDDEPARVLSSRARISCAGALEMGTVFYIEQRFNPDFGVFEPCSITSTGRGSYIFKRFDGVLISQNLQSGKEVEEGSKFADDAIMSVEDLVSEWGPESYHREPRLSF